MSANDEIADSLVRHAVGLERLSQTQVGKVLAALRRSDVRIVERLATGYDPSSARKQQKALLEQIRAILDAVYTDELGRLRVDLDELAEYEAEFLKGAVEKVAPSLGFTLPGADALHAAVYSRPFQGQLMKGWFEGLPANAFTRLQREITQGYIEGRTNADMIKAIRGTRANGYKDGINGVNQRAAEVTVKTAVAHVSNAARDRTYQSNKRYIRGVQWAAVLDSRTSAICRGRDGMVFAVDKGPRPPAHPRCRSITTPVLKKQGDLPQERMSEVERSKLDGQPPTDLTYGAWLRRQPVDVQNDVLGLKKAVLFRKGELPIDRFIDKSGREYTLDDLKRLNAGAWGKAFGDGDDAVRPAKKAEPFKYEAFAGVKTVAEAEAYLKDNGIVDVAALKGISPTGMSEAIKAAHEVTERFGLEPLAFMGPIKRDTRYRYRQPRNANAAVYYQGKAMHLPTKFGDAKEAERQIRAKTMRAASYKAKRDAIVAAGGRIDPEVTRRVANMGENDYTWSITRATGETERAKTMHHEYGHVIHLIDKRIGPRIDAFLRSERPRAKGWQFLVSEYGGSNDKEYIAETFAIYMGGDDTQEYRIHPKLLAIYKGADKKA